MWVGQNTSPLLFPQPAGRLDTRARGLSARPTPPRRSRGAGNKLLTVSLTQCASL